MAVCKRCGGKIKNPKRCPHCGPQQGPRRGLRPVPSGGRGFWEQTMIYPPFGDVLRRFVTFRAAGSADIGLRVLCLNESGAELAILPTNELEVQLCRTLL